MPKREILVDGKLIKFDSMANTMGGKLNKNDIVDYMSKEGYHFVAFSFYYTDIFIDGVRRTKKDEKIMEFPKNTQFYFFRRNK
jgi:hypothetical protein